MARGVGFRDAVKLLDDGRGVTDRLDRLTGGLLLIATGGGSEFAATLFDPKHEVTNLTRGLYAGMSGRVRGLSRFQRSERLAAAHAVIVVSSYFDALQGLRLPVDLSRPLRGDTVRLAGAEARVRLGGLAEGLLHAQLPIPSPERSFEATLGDLRLYYRDLSKAVVLFLTGLAEWDALDETQQERIISEVPDAALKRYEDAFRRLATEVPEFAYWASALDHRATRHALTLLEELVREVAGGAVPDERRRAMELFHRAALGRPILATGDVPPGISIPSLEHAYVTPSFRAAAVPSSAELAVEAWWAGQVPRDDLDDFLAGYLTSPMATVAPLLVLGQPGSGKSVLTKILAARLPAEEFLVVRVVLREVPADGDLQTQIEYAIRAETGESISWPDLVRTRGDALPVVILDGFDELLQATGVSQTDYLERVAVFQGREATLGRPLAAVVTTRTAVADRARCAPGTVAVRLEPFAARHVEAWLDRWNAANAGVPDLTAEEVQEHGELASQPLLLMMLALFAAGGHPLRRDDAALEPVELYEGLLRGFAEREVSKSGAGLPAEDVEAAVERELTRLSVVAFAMSNRARQWVTIEELDADLTALGVMAPPGATLDTGLRAKLSHGERAIGRFFFVHRSSASRDGSRLGTYEFLHATFGEYLVARMISRELRDLTDVLAVRRTRPADVDEAFLRALLSFQPLSVRATTISFLGDLLRGWPDSQRRLLRKLLIRLFKVALDTSHSTAFASYRPGVPSEPARYANWSCNLLLLLLSVSDEERVSEIMPMDHSHSDQIWPWRDIAMLWRSQLPLEGWNGLVDVLALERTFVDGKREALVRLWRFGAVSFDPVWFYGDERTLRGRGGGLTVHDLRDVIRHAHLLTDRRVDILAHSVSPFAEYFPPALIRFAEDEGGGVRSLASVLTELWLRSDEASPDEVANLYTNALRVARTIAQPTAGHRFVILVARQFSLDHERLPGPYASRFRRAVASLIGTARTAELLGDIGREPAQTQTQIVLPDAAQVEDQI